MNFNEYQERAKTTAQYPDLNDLVIQRAITDGIIDKVDWLKKKNAFFSNPYYPALGLAGEVGEFCNKLKKVMRDNNGEIDQKFLDFAHGELGDVLWYLSALCSELGISLADVAAANLEKLASRKARGVIQGNGDNR
jgi:NTP pyrophosphatase (non-canonical NTP hydrolase)